MHLLALRDGLVLLMITHNIAGTVVEFLAQRSAAEGEF